MQSEDYILHVRDGKPRKILIRKTHMSKDPEAYVQGLCLIQAPNGNVDAGWDIAMANSDFFYSLATRLR